MTNFVTPPPPPMSRDAVATKAGPIGWGAVAAGVLGLLALILPWFTPKITGAERPATSGTSFHPWNGFFFLIIAPVVLILAAVMWFQAMQGKHNSRFAGSDNPVRSLSVQSIIFGVVSLALGLLSFVILTATYKFKTGAGTLSWSEASRELKAVRDTLSRGPQIGLYLLFLGALMLIAVGVIGLLTKPTVAPGSAVDQGGNGSSPGFEGAPQGYGDPSGYGGPGNGALGYGGQAYGGPAYGGQAYGGPGNGALGYGGPGDGAAQGSGFPPPPPPPGR